ncbi:MAG: Sip1-related alpha-galactosidase [Promethearchaeota archaeon]
MSFYTKNGHLNYNNKEILSIFNQNIKIYREFDTKGACFLEFSKPKKISFTSWNGISIKEINQFTALYRKKSYWYWPHFGSKESQIPKFSTIVWIKRKDNLKVLLVPLIDKGYNCYINGGIKGIEILADNKCLKGNTKRIVCLYVGVGEDVYELTEKAAHDIIEFVGVGLLRKEKRIPPWVNFLGYCTWNTFYKNINQENVYRMLYHLVIQNKINLGYLLLDDGWQIIKFLGLQDKGADKRKFPDGLEKLFELIRNNFHIEDIIVWHTFQGYWGGIFRKGRYGKDFKAISMQFHRTASYPRPLNLVVKILEKIGSDWYPIARYMKLPIGICLPDQMAKLWDDYHGWLASQGVTGVKVDNQTAMEILAFNIGYQANLMRDYHRVLEESVSKHFSKFSLINCMAMNVNVFYQLVESNITRNSDDYFPKNEASQPEHIIVNAYNNLWCGHFSLPDWDMFQSDHPWGAYQAASRSISGSPIYFADAFKNVDKELISRIALPNGRLLRCENPSLVCKDMIFKNPAKPGRALKIFNHNKYNSLLGIFNVLRKEDTKSTYSPSDIENLNPNDKFAVFRIELQTLEKMEYQYIKNIQLKNREFEIFIISPIKNGFAPIGMIDKFNPGGIFQDLQYIENKIIIKVIYGGFFGFFSEKRPLRILIDDEDITYNYKTDENFLSFKSKPYENQRIEIVY